jgi:hypothetical protein
MKVTSREELKEYCLRDLGAGLIEIDITDEAMEDRIDEALAFFNEYYFDGSDRFFYPHEVTAEDISNGFITLPDHIWGVNSIMPFSSNASTSPSIFDVQYQLRQWDMQNLISSSLIYYHQVMSHLALIEAQLTVQRQFRFNRNVGKLYLDMNWENRVAVGTYLMVDCFSVVDPETNTKFWDNRQFKHYVSALFKLQWSKAYSKYDSIALPGGVTINGKEMYREAMAEKKEIEDDIINNQLLGFSVG